MCSVTAHPTKAAVMAAAATRRTTQPNETGSVESKSRAAIAADPRAPAMMPSLATAWTSSLDGVGAGGDIGFAEEVDVGHHDADEDDAADGWDEPVGAEQVRDGPDEHPGGQ